MTDRFVILDHTFGPLLKTGQTTDRTPAGRTTKDDGGFQRGILGSKLDAQYEILTIGQYSGTTVITINGKTDTHSNECVFDKTTSLMWSRTLSASVFGTGTENLLWDDTGGSDEDIFEFCDKANLGSLGGYTDWRIPNIHELCSLIVCENPAGYPNPAAFPEWQSSGSTVWSSTTLPPNSLNALYVIYSSGVTTFTLKSNRFHKTALCRLGIQSP